MTNREAYMSDLDDLQKAIDCLLSMVPAGKTKYEKQIREQAENAAGAAREAVPAARRGAGPGHGARAPGEGGEQKCQMMRQLSFPNILQWFSD